MPEILHLVRPYLEIVLVVSTAVYAAGIAWFVRGLRALSNESVKAEARASTGRTATAVASGGADVAPKVSVVMAARDEAAHIEACLELVWGQTCSAAAYEIIVVDDRSTDGTRELAMAFAAAKKRQDGIGPRVRILSTEDTIQQDAQGRSGSKKAALGLGIEAAEGEIILTTDADCRVPDTWVEQMSACFGPDVGMVVGFSQVGEPGSVQGFRRGWEAVDFLSLMVGAAGSAAGGHPLAASGQNFGFRKKAFDDVGGYSSIRHRVSGDDVLLLQLMRRHGGWRIVFCAARQAFVVHPPSVSWRALLSQRIRWASNAPYQLRQDSKFFLYLSAVFGMSLLLSMSPVLVLSGALGPTWAIACWGVKLVSEGILFRKGARLFLRRDLTPYLLLWSVATPYFLLVVGVLGVFGRFTWKERPGS
jgi:cellulose synthase/poly-beta-1,6-N-acetylglucosamine synthase-like glycosyltransferase